MSHSVFTRLGIVIVITFLFAGSFSYAQTQSNSTPSSSARLVLTWKANTLYPSDYTGKAFPGARSSITASVEGYSGGKWIDLSHASVTWLLDDKVIGRGVGMRELMFKIPERPDSVLTLRAKAVLPSPELTLESVSSIPVMGPQVVLNTPFPSQTVAAQSRFTVEAIPYFWNIETINDILFSWTANDTQKNSLGERAISLTVGTPSNDFEKNLLVTVLLQNPKLPTEFAKQTTQLEIQ